MRTEADDPLCIDAGLAADLLASLPWQRLVVLGDSVTAGVMDPLPGYATRSFADRLSDALAATRPDFESRNLAHPFLRIAEIRDRQLGPAIAFAPDVALVSAGGNDAFEGLDAAGIRRGLEQLLRPLVASGILPVTIGLFDLARSGLVRPSSAAALARRFDELDRVTADLVRELGGVHVDTHHHPAAADPGIFAADRVHANARGHAIAFAAIVETLAEESPARIA